jgi:outer membrane protein assembly factor BamA
MVRALLLCAAVVGLSGCRKGPSAAELRGAEYAVRKVEFEGVTRFKAKQVHEYLELRPTDWTPLPEKHYFYPGLIPVDSDRLLELYAAHGYYEAEIVDVRVDYDERRSKVDLTIVVDEGPVTLVEELVVRWPEGPAPGPPAKQRVGALTRAPTLDPEALAKDAVTLRAGEAFEIEPLQASSSGLREALRGAGHPFATVEEQVVVDRAKRTARVELVVRPGPFMRIGSITIEGLETVPERPVRVAAEFALGHSYSPRTMIAIEQRVHALGVFSTVAVSIAPHEQGEDEDADPDAADDADDEDEAERGSDDGLLDLVVRVRESDPQRIQLGVALGLEPNRWDQRAVARYSNANVFRNLYQLTLTARAGYAELPNPFRPIEHGPIADLGLRVEKQGLLEKHLVWTIEPELELGIQQGYQFWSANHRFGLSRFFTRWFGLELSHTLRYVDFFSVSPSLALGDTLLGLDFRDPYVISYVGIKPTLYAVDQINAPNHGVILQLEYRVAGGPFGGQFDFQELSPSVRAYWRPIERVQLAARAKVGMIFPFGKNPGAPIDLRMYLGGTDTVRGWGLRRLAPRIGDCEPGEDWRRGACESIPVGGNSSVLGNAELRVRTWGKLWVAGFFDLGDVRAGVTEFGAQEWNYSSGGGLRYDSIIGKFRLDVGVRLNETQLSQGEPIWALHFGLGESF